MYSGVISAFCDRIQKGEGITVYGDGEQTRDFVHAQDVSTAIWQCLTQAGNAEGRVMNVGTGRQTSLLQLIETLADLTGHSIEPAFAEARAGDVKHSLADISALQKWTGFKPEISLKDGLEKLLNDQS